jgi:hypothetical protein
VQRPDGGPIDAEFFFSLEHKSGEYWIGWAETGHADKPEACVEVQFRVDVKGVVAQLGINMRLEDGAPLTWFDRVAT